MAKIQAQIDAISSTVDNVTTATTRAMEQQPELTRMLHDRTGVVIHNITSGLANLKDTGAEGSAITVPEQLREVTSKLPPIAFQIAREMKELVQRLDLSQSFDDNEDDDFR